MSIPSARPAVDDLPDEAKARMGLVLPGELRKLFTVAVERKKAVIDLPDQGGVGAATLEVAVDRGDVRAGRKTDIISEVEIELVAGDASAIYDLAAAIVDAGLSVGKITKAERGFALLDGGEAPTAKRAARLSLDKEQSTSDALAAILAAGIESLLDNEAAAVDGTDPEGIHQMRVALRRMRSALSVFRKTLDPKRIAWASAELKWLADECGPARDGDVFISEILRPVSGFGIDTAGIDALIAQAAARRDDGYARVRAAIASPRYAKLLLGLSKFVETRGWLPQNVDAAHPLLQPLGDGAGDILAHAFKKLRKQGKGLAEMRVADRHEVRIALKKFRYTVDALQTLYPAADVAPFAKALARMQDQFGHLNDVSVAQVMLADLVKAKGINAAERRLLERGAGEVIGWHARGVHDQEQKFIRDWKALMKTPPFWTAPAGDA
jgi:inorganic triphosphatase YgiF